MKNEVMARALTDIDDDLIADARTSARKSKRLSLYRFGAAAAACLILTFGILFYTNLPGGGEITVAGTLLADEPVAIGAISPAAFSVNPMQRSDDTLTVSLELVPDGKARIRTEDGSFAIVPAGADTSIYTGIDYTADESVTVKWAIPSPDTSRTYRLTVGRKQLMLYYDASVNNWLIAKQ